MAATNASKTQVKPFTINIPQSALDDLQARLSLTRWPDEVDGAGWTMGTRMGYMQDLVNHWQTKYDWRKHEAALNQFHHFTADIDGVNIHFIHERGKGPNPTPLLLIHGWPDSFYRYHKIIPMLTDPAKYGGDPNNAFDVIVPSIPGTGFSDRTVLNDEDNADLFAKLMTEVLGYEKFISAGGDHGALITLPLAHRHPELLLGIHVTDVGYPDGNTDFSSLTPPEMEMVSWVQQWFMAEGAYNMIQATKPQTLAFSLNDSPAGLAAWIISCSSSGKRGNEEFEQRFNMDELLTNIMIYWVTQTIGSSMRGYWVATRTPSTINPAERPSVPAAVAHCPYDPPLPRAWAERKVNVVHFTDLERGGHFAAWEEPALIAADIQDFVRQISQ